MEIQMPSLILGIESTAHTFGASVASSERHILSDVKRVYVPSAGQGIHPREAAQHHSSIADVVIRNALTDAAVEIEEIDGVAVALGPGLGPTLRIGATIARAIASRFQIPLISVHHAIGHIEIGSLTTGSRDPLVVLLSGGHTTIAAFASGRWRIYGETEDITLGNLLDMFARSAGLASPGGPVIERLAAKSTNFIELPYTVKGNDVSYSGLLTAATKLLDRGGSVEDLCYSVQEVSFSMLAEAVERSLAHTEKKEALLVGGVAANSVLRKKLEIVAEEHSAAFQAVDPKFAGDCGAQISWTGVLAFGYHSFVQIERSQVRPRWRLDEVEIPWR
jgi:N6-L-threonylcarbamoyladenine synthase